MSPSAAFARRSRPTARWARRRCSAYMTADVVWVERPRRGRTARRGTATRAFATPSVSGSRARASPPMSRRWSSAATSCSSSSSGRPWAPAAARRRCCGPPIVQRFRDELVCARALLPRPRERARGVRRRVRVVAGRLQRAPARTRRAGARTRPTADRVREALFSMLGDVERRARARPVRGLGRARDRGALARRGGAVFVERDPRAVAAIRRNLEAVGRRSGRRRARRAALPRARTSGRSTSCSSTRHIIPRPAWPARSPSGCRRSSQRTPAS